jgi:hypothetical protein
MSGKFSQSAANLCLVVVCIVGAMGILHSAGHGRLAFGGILMLVGFCFIVSHLIKPLASAQHPPDLSIHPTFPATIAEDKARPPKIPKVTPPLKVDPAPRHPVNAGKSIPPPTDTKPPQGFHENAGIYFFSLGENGLAVSATVEGLKRGQKPFVGFPITVFAKDNDDKIHYRISVWNGISPVEVSDNEFSLNQPFWDRNFDNTTLEVVDEKQSPVLQVFWKTPTHLVVNGVFQTQDGHVVIADSNGWRPFRPGDKIKPLFKYPSRRFPGQYAETN